MKRIFLTATLLSVMALAAMGQTEASMYFMDGLATRNSMNPAFASERNYISLPFGGHSSLGIAGDVTVKDFIMPRTVDGQQKMVTFLHPSVSPEELTFGAENKMTGEARVQVLGLGFHLFGGFAMLEVNERRQAHFNLPGELFRMMKDLHNEDYNVGHGEAFMQSWTEVGLGYSRQAGKHLRVGGKVKFLTGLSRLNGAFEDLRLNLSQPDQWNVTGKAIVDVSHKGFTWGEPLTKDYKSQLGSYECVDWNNIYWGKNRVAVSGYGAAVDLGLEYKFGGLLKGLALSASATDLGLIRWGHTQRASNKGKPFTFDGFHNVRVKGHEGDVPFKDQGQQLLDNLADLYTVQAEDGGHPVSSICPTIRVGAAYALPFYKRLKVGLLGTSHLMGDYTLTEGHLVATVNPVDFLELSVSGTAGTLGKSWGCALNIKPKYFNLFVGIDHYFGNVGRPFVPLGQWADVYAGVNVTVNN